MCEYNILIIGMTGFIIGLFIITIISSIVKYIYDNFENIFLFIYKHFNYTIQEIFSMEDLHNMVKESNTIIKCKRIKKYAYYIDKKHKKIYMLKCLHNFI